MFKMNKVRKREEDTYEATIMRYHFDYQSSNPIGKDGKVSFRRLSCYAAQDKFKQNNIVWGNLEKDIMNHPGLKKQSSSDANPPEIQDFSPLYARPMSGRKSMISRMLVCQSESDESEDERMRKITTNMLNSIHLNNRKNKKFRLDALKNKLTQIIEQGEDYIESEDDSNLRASGIALKREKSSSETATFNNNDEPSHNHSKVKSRKIPLKTEENKEMDSSSFFSDSYSGEGDNEDSESYNNSNSLQDSESRRNSESCRDSEGDFLQSHFQ
ncbi:unnamed protein product [Moneuplotes crassus]|uniref:Uncharacterized protein n=1 Tax=Euplotes crassus TaxID=5936 RepID=A0AAD1UUA0_EUPCR|nr:unnamed protein product [Moneuplotes crassus]